MAPLVGRRLGDWCESVCVEEASHPGSLTVKSSDGHPVQQPTAQEQPLPEAYGEVPKQHCESFVPSLLQFMHRIRGDLPREEASLAQMLLSSILSFPTAMFSGTDIELTGI